VIATCRSESDKEIAARAGTDEVLLTGGNLAERIRALAPDGVDHIVEVAFGANIKTVRCLGTDSLNRCKFLQRSGLGAVVLIVVGLVSSTADQPASQPHTQKD
jgi:hypothetical protein